MLAKDHCLSVLLGKCLEQANHLSFVILKASPFIEISPHLNEEKWLLTVNITLAFTEVLYKNYYLEKISIYSIKLILKIAFNISPAKI